jgi:cyanophycin synthetase
MEIKKVDIRVMRGPNYWSVRHPKLIVLTLDLRDFKEQQVLDTEDIEARLHEMFPRLKHYAEGVIDHSSNNGSLSTFIATRVEVAARALMRMAGMEKTYGAVHYSGKNYEYYVVFSYEVEEAGWYAAEAAVDIVQSILDGQDYDVERDFEELDLIVEDHSHGPSTNAIVQAAVNRGIPFRELANGAVIAFGQGKHLKRIQGSICESTSIIGVDLASHKDDTKKLLEAAFIPVPKGVMARSIDELEDIAADLGFPLVVKPLDGHQGKGITANITKQWELEEAFGRAQEHSRQVIVEKYIKGDDYRVLAIGYKFIAAAKRTPAAVTGDGRSTISELIEQVNKDPRRGSGHGKTLTKIVPDAVTHDILRSQDLTLDSVLSEGEVLYLKDTANLSTGGTATDVTDTVHPDNILLIERVSRIVGLDICGIDIVAADLSTPLVQNGGAVIEVNAAPGLRMHLAPSEGTPRNVGDPIVDLMFPNGSTGRIPIVAVTGTNGKTTTARLMSHIAQTAGFNAGLTTTDGIYINGRVIGKGDFTGPKSSEVVLTDPTVDFAVLECARGGMLRSGLAFDYCNVGIVTNVAEDHLGMKGINTIDDMARVKAVVPKTVHKDGVAVLNAEDDLVYQMKNGLKCKVALFSLDDKNPRFAEHIEKGGIGATVQDGYITLLVGSNPIAIERAEDIPLTMGGKAPFMIQNVLAAVLAAHAMDLDLSMVREALKTFHPSSEQTPGRMNMFAFGKYDVMVDYAHNPPSLEALGRYLKNLDGTHKVGIITGVGDRRDEDVINMGKAAARIFDEIIIRVDKDTRGREADNIIDLVSEGVKQGNSKIPVQVIPDEREALVTAMRKAKKGTLIVIATEKVEPAIKMVQQLQAHQEQY